MNPEKVQIAIVCLLSLMSGTLQVRGQDLLFKPVLSILSEVRVINETAGASITNGIANWEAEGLCRFLTWAKDYGDDCNPELNFFSIGKAYVTGPNATTSFYPENELVMLHPLTEALHRLKDLQDAEERWWSVVFSYDDSSVGFEEQSYVDCAGGIHHVFRFYDLP